MRFGADLVRRMATGKNVVFMHRAALRQRGSSYVGLGKDRA